MPAKPKASKVNTDIDNILNVWRENPDLVLKREKPTDPDITLADVETLRKGQGTLLLEIAGDESRLKTKTDNRDDTSKALSDIRTRMMSLFRGVFGPNSSQYERGGGTRQVDRKSPSRTRKAKATGAVGV